MNITISHLKSDVFTQLFQYLKSFTDVIVVQLLEDRLYVQGMDNAHVSLFEINLSSEWFESYHVQKNESMGINTTILSKILSTREQNQNVYLNKTDEDLLSIIFDSDDKNEFKKEYMMPLIDVDHEQMNITGNEYNLEMTMDSKKFKHMIDEFNNFGSNLKITYDGEHEKIMMIMESDNMGEMMVHVNLEDMQECAINEEEFQTCAYSVKYIHNMCQYHKISKHVNLYFSHDVPLQCKYIISDNETQNDYIRFFLAPKIDD